MFATGCWRNLINNMDCQFKLVVIVVRNAFAYGVQKSPGFHGQPSIRNNIQVDVIWGRLVELKRSVSFLRHEEGIEIDTTNNPAIRRQEVVADPALAPGHERQGTPA